MLPDRDRLQGGLVVSVQLHANRITQRNLTLDAVRSLRHLLGSLQVKHQVALANTAAASSPPRAPAARTTTRACALSSRTTCMRCPAAAPGPSTITTSPSRTSTRAPPPASRR